MTIPATTLNTLAEAARGFADTIDAPSGPRFREANHIRTAVQDAKREIDAASGYSTVATLAWSICVDNDRETYDTIRAMVAEHANSETARADLADALKDWTENTSGLEGVRVSMLTIVGDDTGVESLSSLMATLIHSAIVAIDWHWLAMVLLDKHEED